MNYRDFIEQMQADSEEDARRRKERLDRIKSSRNSSTQAREEESIVDKLGGVLSGAGRAVGGVANFGKEMLVDPIINAAKTSGTGVGHIFDDISGATSEREAQFTESQDKWQKMLIDEIEKSKNEGLDAREREKARKSAETINRAMDSERKDFQANLNTKIEETDPLKQAGANVALATTVLPGRLPLGKLAPASAAAAPTLRGAGVAAGADAVLGGVGGVAEALQRDNETGADILRSALIGGASGGALGGGSQLVDSSVRREAGDAIGRARSAFSDIGGRQTVTPPPVAPQAPVGDVTSRLSKTLQEADANPTTMRGTVNPTTGMLEGNKPDLSEGIVTQSREQIMEDNKVQRKVGDKLYESFFDVNAPLGEYAKAYKSKTGNALEVDRDPRALAQLRNGADEAAAARMSDLTDDMEFISKNKLGDAWKELGVANQVVNDRAGAYAPDVVAAEAGKIKRLQETLSPEQFEQVQTAVQRTIEFQDSQLVRLRDSGFISQEGYDAIKEVNPNYFTRFNFADYIDDNQRLFASRNSNNISKNIIQAVKGQGEDAKYVIEDPAQAITRSVFKQERLIQSNQIFQAIDSLRKDLPDMAIKIRDADDVAERMSLSLENKELRPIRNQIDRAIKRDNVTVRRLESQINQLEKRGLKLSLKKGGERMTSDPFAPAGLGGDVPTSKAGQTVRTATDDQTDLVKQLEGAVRKDGASELSRGLRQDVIAEGAGTAAQTNPSKLGASDTKSFLTNLIENGSRGDINKIKKMVGNRDQKLVALLDELDDLKTQFDDKAGTIKDNIGKAKELADYDVPDGYEAISGWRNGIKEVIAVPEYIAQAYKGKNDAQIGTMERIFSAASKPFKAAATIFSPAFLVKNSIRDTGTHWLTSQNISKADRLTILPYAKQWVDGFMDSWKSTEFAQTIAKEGGGAAGVFNSASDVVRGTDQMVNQTVKGITGEAIKTPQNMFQRAAEITGVAKAGRAYSNVMQRTGRALEYAPRLAEARAAIRNGGSDKTAALAARQALGDLQNGGTVSRLLNNYTPFFNSILQGNLRIVQSARENPQNAIAMASAGIVLPAVSGYVWNRTMYPDVLNSIPEYERESNFVIILGDEQDEEGNYTQVLKIPKNDAAKIIGNNIEVALDKMAGENDQGFAELFMKTIGYAQPVQVERDGDASLGALVGSLPITSNPLIRTPFELATNQSLFTGREIVSEKKQGLEVEDQIDEKTSVIDAAGARALDPIAGLVGADVAPDQVGQLRQGVSAGLLNGKSPVDQVKNVVSGSKGTRGDNEFYQISGEVSTLKKKASNAINQAIAEGDIEGAQAIAAEYNALRVEKFQPWVKNYSNDASDDMYDQFDSLKLNLSSRSIKQRRKNASQE